MAKFLLIDSSNEEVFSSEADLEEIRVKKKLIVGDEQSGKTSLAKKVYHNGCGSGFCPLYIDCSKVSKSSVDKVVKSVIKDQYENVDLERFKQIDKLDKIAIIDDFDQIKMNEKASKIFLRNLEDTFGSVFVFSSKAILFEGDVEALFEDYEKREIKLLGHYCRSLIINNWNSLGEEETIDDNEILKRNDFSSRHIDSMLRRNIVPPKPVYILMILQTLNRLCLVILH